MKKRKNHKGIWACFLNDYEVRHHTNGDSFGQILENNNLLSKIYNIVQATNEVFNIRKLMLEGHTQFFVPKTR